MSEVFVQAFILAGSVFMLLAGIGVLRMPDLYMRLSTVTKGSTMGIFLLLVGVMIEFHTLGVFIKVLAVLVFGLVTSPVAAHMVSRAAYFQGVELWEGTQVDEIAGRYEIQHHGLFSPKLEETLASTILHDDAEGSHKPPEPE